MLMDTEKSVYQHVVYDSEVERDGHERLYFVVETKSSLLTEDLYHREGGKIECGRAHFTALGIGENPAIYEKFKDVDGLLAYEARCVPTSPGNS
jgi:restriction endonuclease